MRGIRVEWSGRITRRLFDVMLAFCVINYDCASAQLFEKVAEEIVFDTRSVVTNRDGAPVIAASIAIADTLWIPDNADAPPSASDQVPTTPSLEVAPAPIFEIPILPPVDPVQSRVLITPWWASLENASPELLQGHQWHLDELIWLALEHSPYVQGLLIDPQIEQARASQANGQFDPTPFLESIFNDTSNPVGNTLTTGKGGNLNEHLVETRGGVRSRNTRGGQTEFSQEALYRDNNSNFFTPRDQADTKMLLRYTQPLKRGAGVAYNCSTYVVATLNANQSMQEVTQKIQEHASLITSAYWELYVARSYVSQIERGLVELRRLQEQLEGRADFDSLRNQVLRAEAAIKRQSANLAGAKAKVVSSEANLRAAIAAPNLLDRTSGLVIPATPTADWPNHISLESELNNALLFHPHVQALSTNLKAARVRLKVAENELRPTLDLVLEGYLRGLNGDYNVAKSLGDQFSKGAPSYSAGLSFSRPYRNIAAQAILRERRLLLKQVLMELDNALLTIGANVEGAVAEVEAAFSELEAVVQVTLATHAEVKYLAAKWQDAFLDGGQTNLIVEQLLNAEIQLIEAENAWARAQADHMLALTNLRLTTGSLLPSLSVTGR